MSKFARRAVRALVLLALPALSGCPHHGRIARVYPAPAPAELRQLVVARQRAGTSINGSARATSWLGGDRFRATVLVLVERPGRLRLEAEVSLQGTVAVLATDGQRFALLDVRKNELRRGPACPANIASLIRIPLSPAEVAALFLGDAKLPDGAAADRAGKPSWRAGFEEFVDVASARGAVSLPQVIHYAEGTASFDDGVEIKFKDRTANDPIAADAFTLAAPAGTPVIEVGCSER